jgi:hypothetical protein
VVDKTNCILEGHGLLNIHERVCLVHPGQRQSISRTHIILVEVQMNVRRRLQFLNHEMIGSRISCVSDHFDLSRGEIWGGKNFLGRQSAEDGLPLPFWVIKARFRGGMSGSILTVDLQNPTWL